MAFAVLMAVVEFLKRLLPRLKSDDGKENSGYELNRISSRKSGYDLEQRRGPGKWT